MENLYFYYLLILEQKSQRLSASIAKFSFLYRKRYFVLMMVNTFFFLENRRKVEKHGPRSLLLWDLATMLLVGIIIIPLLITSMDSTYSLVFNRELCYRSVVAWVNLVN